MPESLADELTMLARRAQHDARLPSLSAAVFRHGEVVWELALGVADVDERIPATPETQYRIASITKTFTAAAILQLRDAGALELDDPLAAHVAEAAHGSLTLRRLLSHLSGLQREPAGAVWETLEFPTREELLDRLADAERVLSPGERWHYSNLAYSLLGEVVARRSGQPYQAYVEECLLAPLGLERTTWQLEEPHARGYLVEPYSDGVRPEPDVDARGTASAGQLASTVRDLARWGVFLAEPDASVLAPAAVDEMHEVAVMAEPDWTLGWGLGVMLVRRGERIYAGHTGGLPGFLSFLVYSRKERVGAVVLANSSTWPKLRETGLDLVDKALERVPAEPDEWTPDEAPPAELAGVLGRWWSEGSEAIFSFRRRRLEARLADAPRDREPSVFEPIGPDEFRTVSGPERGERLQIVRDDDGDVVKLYWATYPFLRTPETFGALRDAPVR